MAAINYKQAETRFGPNHGTIEKAILDVGNNMLHNNSMVETCTGDIRDRHEKSIYR